MSASLDYQIKKALPALMRDYRWNVLTVLILHANVRNRCWVSMNTVTKMATNGNRNKANRAKFWLEKHLAFELVPNDKRVKEEQRLSPRQHVYQLLGSITPCGDPQCDCREISGVTLYLHMDNGLDGETIENDNNLDGETMHRLDGEILNSLNGETRSIPKEDSPNEVKKKKSPKPPKGAVVDDSPESQAVTAIIHAWLTHTQTIEPNAYKNKSKRSDALFMHNNGVTPEIIGAWAKSLRRTDFWRDKAITWKKLTGEILPFKDNYKPVPHIVPERPFEPAPERAKPDEIISEEEKAELRQIFEELVKSKVANG